MTASVRDVGELELIRRFRRVSGSAGSRGIRTGIGDDTAVLLPTAHAALLATTDLLVEDVHFRRATASPRDIGWKALAVNLSDIAAMGGTPRWALLALALPASAPVEDVEAFYGGLHDAAAPHDVVVVGGDTSASTAGWVVNVTVLGEHSGTPRLRSMARPGDAIAVTGTLGRSAAGLAALERIAAEASGSGIEGLSRRALDEVSGAHLRPTPRVREGRWLGTQEAVHALMDCSDGLASDLGHICRESGVGARVVVERLPIGAAVRETGRALSGDPIAWATGGGEDYELLLTCDPGAAGALADALVRETGTPLTVVGEIVEGDPAVTWVDERGARVSIGRGFEHFHG